MSITPLPTPPDRGMDPDEFVAAADAFLAALPDFATEVQAEVDNINAPTMTDFVRESVIVAANAAALRVAAGVAIGTDVQAYNVNLAAIAGLTLAADKLIYATGAGAVAATDFTSVARTLLSQTTQAGMRSTGLGLGTSSTVDTGTSGTKVPLLDGANTWSGLQTLSAGANLTPAAAPSTTAVGYLGTPQNSKSGNYTTVMSDAGKDVYYTATATHTIPANSSVAYPIGTAYEISAAPGATITINITTDTLRWIPGNSTGSRTLTGPGSAVVKKKTATEWWITGAGLS